jgi:hypothetical protein
VTTRTWRLLGRPGGWVIRGSVTQSGVNPASDERCAALHKDICAKTRTKPNETTLQYADHRGGGWIDRDTSGLT